MQVYRFSVWTPTYNRKDLLKRAYESLVNQSFKNFEWIIIDDGSTDDTKSLVKGFQEENKLQHIRYVWKENGGKHTAWRVATEMFSAPYVITLDSDDTLTYNALAIFDKHWRDLENSEFFEEFWEIKGRTMDVNGALNGRCLPQAILDIDSIKLTYKYGFKSEMQACRKAIVLRHEAKVPDNFLFEQYSSNFGEGVRWANAAKKYKTRFIDEIVRTYYFDAPDQLTNNSRGKYRKARDTYNKLVSSIYLLPVIRTELLRWDKKTYLKMIMTIIYASFCLKLNPFRTILQPTDLDIFLITLLFIPVWVIWAIRK